MADSSKAKMAPASNDEQFKFLISCIRYSNNGKVDFIEVARECSIVSKGAAAKRYERMMKAHGIHQTQANIRDTAISSRPKASTSPLSKKRKFEQNSDDNNNAGDDDEGVVLSVKPEPGSTTIKDEPTAADHASIVPSKRASLTVKDEPATADDTSTTKGAKRQLPIPQTDGADECELFHDFLQDAAFEPRQSIGRLSLDSAFGQPTFNELGTVKLANNGEATHESILITD